LGREITRPVAVNGGLRCSHRRCLACCHWSAFLSERTLLSAAHSLGSVGGNLKPGNRNGGRFVKWPFGRVV
jgi:hypothetical protein